MSSVYPLALCKLKAYLNLEVISTSRLSAAAGDGTGGDVLRGHVISTSRLSAAGGGGLVRVLLIFKVMVLLNFKRLLVTIRTRAAVRPGHPPQESDTPAPPLARALTGTSMSYVNAVQYYFKGRLTDIK